MLKHIFVSLFLLTLGLHLQSQNTHFGLEFGLQGYNMGELKELNSQILNQIPFEAGITENFPAFYTYGGYCYFDVTDKTGIGVFYTYKSTGSRISRKDYSGNYIFDMLISGNAFGSIINFNIFNKSHFSINAYNNLGWICSKLNYNETITIYELEEVTDKYVFNSTDLFVDPNLKFGYSLHSYSINLGIGYQLNISKSDLTLKSDDRIILVDKKGTPVNANWSGFHLNVSLGYRF